MNVLLEILNIIVLVLAFSFLIEAIVGTRFIKNLSTYITWRRILGFSTLGVFALEIFLIALNAMI